MNEQAEKESARTMGATLCPSCGTPAARPFVCAACGALWKEPAGLDHFGFFGLPRSYDVDPAALEKAYLELSRLLHPDRQIARKGAPKDGAEGRRLRALALSATMNSAYETLKNPAKRAEYLLRLGGGAGPEKDRRTPEGFLPEMLELREELEEAKAASDRPGLEARRGEIALRRDRVLEAVRGQLARLPAPDAAAEARIGLNALKYLTNVLDEIDLALRA